MKRKSLSAKQVSLYGFLTAAALLFGYVEYLVPLNFIAPGVKLGIANGVVLLLILQGKLKAALLINIVRIVLSALLYASPFSLLFSFTAGVISTFLMILFSSFKGIGIVGLSVMGSVIHNLIQLCIATLTVGDGVWFYAPFLLISGLVAGTCVAFLTWLVMKNLKIF